MKRIAVALWAFGPIGLFSALDGAASAGEIAFPEIRPQQACRPRPLDGERLTVTPPGFCWWRAAERGKAQYRLLIRNAAGEIAYASEPTEDPAHVPTRAIAPGEYTWTVEALDAKGAVKDIWPEAKFAIEEGAFEQPWPDIDALLKRVPAARPRLPHLSSGLLPEAYPFQRLPLDKAPQGVIAAAEKGLKLELPAEPDYDKLENAADRRMGYWHSYQDLRKHHNDAMVEMAYAYRLTGEKRFAEGAKAQLLNAAKWDPEGISSILSPYGDEVGLALVRSSPRVYDWIYDAMTDEERALAKGMLIARADQMLRRLTQHDFLARPENSHDGRLPGFLIDHAIALAEEPRARVWLDYAMRCLLTVYPHWGGKDGGWAEGINYGLSYNSMLIGPAEALRVATGFDFWKRPFFQKVRYFFMYCVSPLGEISPFGDTEQNSILSKRGSIGSLVGFHARQFQDPVAQWWVELLEGKAKTPPPADLPNDRAFFGVGWAALHSDFAKPEDDLFLLFKSSPYGAVSHSHADQNTFAIMKGGKALAIPAGERYPAHGTPFHVEYVQQTMAHNGILVNGEGQINRDGNASGELAQFESRDHWAYVRGDAAKCYGKALERFERHVLMIRPSLIVVVDDLAAPKPAEFQWLLHTLEKMKLDEKAQSIVSTRGEWAMPISLFTSGGFSFSQTDEWPVDPKKGYPNTIKPLPTKNWHLTATTNEKAAARRIAAIMPIAAKGEKPEVKIEQKDENRLVLEMETNAGEARIEINLSTQKTPILQLRFAPRQGPAEEFVVK